jgi:hypothetical protein
MPIPLRWRSHAMLSWSRCPILCHTIAKTNETIIDSLRYKSSAMLRFAEISVCVAFLIAGALTLRYLDFIMR